jgi:hypothetical protein
VNPTNSSAGTGSNGGLSDDGTSDQGRGDDDLEDIEDAS